MGRGLVIASFNASFPCISSQNRLVYYRIYARDGAIETNNRIYSNDEFLSRIFTKSVAPPHTVASLKKHLCKTEGFAHSWRYSSLFASLSDKEATLDAEFISLFDPSGPGSSEHDPVALVVYDNRARKSIAANLKNLPKRPDARNPSYGKSLFLFPPAGG
ncbi:hypothetical protein K443DRAFT_92290 [Laccaria amethystina LaAM-08-1]|uniref:Uncharacterized protein n=1 Tax=Laccaria amethystina LaAM-08-1 TaxID=1095629 RepID=A0A0C9XII9_9AGAR|nr:hypothetical protein K443DRAFT_92290 [Laccaria amethystina LaAM-08-1]